MSLVTNMQSYATIYANIFGSCSPIDASYYLITQLSGGQLFVLDRLANEIAPPVIALLTPTLQANRTTIFAASNTLSLTQATSLTIPIYSDASLTSLTFSITVSSVESISITDPFGLSLGSGSTVKANITSLSGGTIINIAQPPLGQFSAVISGSGAFSISVMAASSVSISSVAYVEWGGRPTDQSWVAQTQSPIATFPSQYLIALSIDPTSLGFQPDGSVSANAGQVLLLFVTTDGRTLSSIPLQFQAEQSMSGGSQPTSTFLGLVDVTPSVPFRVQVLGFHSAGDLIPFQRTWGTVFTPQTLELNVQPAPPVLPVGAATRMAFALTNHGSSDTFVVRVSIPTLQLSSALLLSINGQWSYLTPAVNSQTVAGYAGYVTGQPPQAIATLYLAYNVTSIFAVEVYVPSTFLSYVNYTSDVQVSVESFSAPSIVTHAPRFPNAKIVACSWPDQLTSSSPMCANALCDWTGLQVSDAAVYPANCSCVTGWAGKDCATPVCPAACGSYGTCNTATHLCVCQTGWTGLDCSLPSPTSGVASLIAAVNGAVWTAGVTTVLATDVIVLTLSTNVSLATYSTGSFTLAAVNDLTGISYWSSTGTSTQWPLVLTPPVAVPTNTSVHFVFTNIVSGRSQSSVSHSFVVSAAASPITVSFSLPQWSAQTDGSLLLSLCTPQLYVLLNTSAAPTSTVSVYLLNNRSVSQGVAGSAVGSLATLSSSTVGLLVGFGAVPYSVSTVRWSPSSSFSLGIADPHNSTLLHSSTPFFISGVPDDVTWNVGSSSATYGPTSTVPTVSLSSCGSIPRAA